MHEMLIRMERIAFTALIKVILFLGIVSTLAPAINAWIMIHEYPENMPIGMIGKSVNSRKIPPVVLNPWRFILTHPMNSNRNAVTLLGPALSSNEIDIKLNILLKTFKSQYDVSPIHKIYGVSNGVLNSDSVEDFHTLYLFLDFYFLSLEEAIDTYSSLIDGKLRLKSKTNEMLLNVNSSTSWFPIMSSGRGRLVLIDLSTRKVLEKDFTMADNELIGEYDGIYEYFCHITRLCLSTEECERHMIANFENNA